MKETQFKYTSAIDTDKWVLATYRDGVLFKLHGIHMIGDLWDSIPINKPIPHKEEEVVKMAQLCDYAVTVEKVKETSTGAKVRAFSAAYKDHLGITYKVLKNEPRKLEGIPVDSELLAAYFTSKEWWGNQPKSITNYTRNINNVRQLLASKEIPKNDFPDDWSKDYYSSLKPPSKAMDYLKHLYRLGWRFERDKRGEVKSAKKLAALGLFLLVLSLPSCITIKWPKQANIEPVPDSIEVEVKTVISDTLSIEADTSESLLGWQDFFGAIDGDTAIIFEDSNKVIQVTDLSPEDWAGFWQVDQGEKQVDSFETARKKYVKIRVIDKPKKLETRDTQTIKTKVKNPAKEQGAHPAINGQPDGTLYGIIGAALGLVLAVIAYIGNRKKGQRKNG